MFDSCKEMGYKGFESSCSTKKKKRKERKQNKTKQKTKQKTSMFPVAWMHLHIAFWLPNLCF